MMFIQTHGLHKNLINDDKQKKEMLDNIYNVQNDGDDDDDSTKKDTCENEYRVFFSYFIILGFLPLGAHLLLRIRYFLC